MNKGRKKIAQVITRMDWGGSPDIVRIICENLNKEKFDFRFISGPTKHPTIKTNEFLNRYKDKIISVSYLKRNINPILDLYALTSLYRIFKKEKFDIVHTHTAKAGILGRIAANLARVPVVVHTSHGHNFYGYFNPLISKLIVWIERVLSLLTDKIVVLTELERKDLLKFKIAKQEKIEFIHTAVELDRYKRLSDSECLSLKKELNIKDKEIVIGMVGRLEPIKGISYFIEAAVSIAQTIKYVRFIIVGEGSLRKEMQAEVTNAKVDELFTFTGWRDDALNIIPLMDILVLPSLNEAVGLVLLEAQGLGIPVVATKVGGIPEVVEDGQSGILVEPANTDALISAIKILILDKEKRISMANYAQAYVKDKYTPNDLVQKLTDIYERLYKQMYI